MKYVVYAALALLIVPFQVVLLDRISIAGVRPDLALVAVCLIGLHSRETEAFTMGIVLGFTQDLLSGGASWGNLCLKPVIGLLAGLARRNLVNLTLTFALALLLTLSIVSGVGMFLVDSLTGAGGDFLVAVRWIILPQACYDALVGVAILRLIQSWTPNRAAPAASSYE